MTAQRLIYVVDDDPFINTLVVNRFASDRYSVMSFENGEDCLKALTEKPDLVILDYFFVNNNRELMNGMEIFDRIKQTHPEVPVIMLSGQDKGEIVLELARKGIDDYVIKDNKLIDNLDVAINNYFQGK
jgi:two-component system, OmpR family, response regulator